MAENNCIPFDRNALVDVSDIQIDRSLPQEERIRSFVRQVKNPYCFRVGDVVVNISYMECGSTLNDRFSELLSILQ